MKQKLLATVAVFAMTGISSANLLAIGSAEILAEG